MKRIVAIAALAFSFAAFATESAPKAEPTKVEAKAEKVEKKAEPAKAEAKTEDKAATPVKGTKAVKKGGSKKVAAPKAQPK